jgi:hypothetical protein
MQLTSIASALPNSTFARSPGVIILVHDLKVLISLMARLSAKSRSL